jgi:hypothetical protein
VSNETETMSTSGGEVSRARQNLDDGVGIGVEWESGGTIR